MHHREIQPKFHSSCDKMDDWDSLITGSSSINWCSVGHISCVLMPPPHDGLISAEMNTNQVFILKFIFNLKLLNLEKSRLFASYLGGLFPHFVQIFASKKVEIEWLTHTNCVIFFKAFPSIFADYCIQKSRIVWLPLTNCVIFGSFSLNLHKFFIQRSHSSKCYTKDISNFFGRKSVQLQFPWDFQLFWTHISVQFLHYFFNFFGRKSVQLLTMTRNFQLFWTQM